MEEGQEDEADTKNKTKEASTEDSSEFEANFGQVNKVNGEDPKGPLQDTVLPEVTILKK